MRWDQDADASGDTRLAADEAVPFEAENHLMDRRGSDAKMALHVGFGRRLTEHARIDVDEGQILALLLGEALRAGVVRGA